ncbi:type II toxin-antitoxin system VapC family toxin [Sphingomonas jatrophae]|uniref:Ribonuclease VapC n=1 Tax=Sphingomonas jatrophae TaxID=1166337 RepID=A0A1I6JY97_9SPHN|nr:type II toxin-antitoxin system VapC family toxin [Sphingomonas jatrophae]SFR83965.1 tRNA(fMet)-specific endonuclease VapC [Sphingomonas jatrophae]
MKYLLDSNAVIALVQNDSAALVGRAATCDEGDLVTSAIVYAEVAYGSSRDKPPAVEQLRALVEEVPVLPFDQAAASVYAGLPFRRGGYDRLIAAHALSLGLTLVTDNVADFADVPGLRVETWTA